MGYGFRTPKYHIPVITLGDRIDPAEEKVAALTIENQILGAIAAHSGGDGVFRTGTMTGTFSSGNSSVSVAPDNNNVSVEAFIRQVFIRSVNTLEFTGIPDNTTVYLIVKLTETETESSRIKGNVELTFNETGVIPDDGILIATATTTGVSISVNTSPTGRVDISTVSDHADTSKNPHTNPLLQDEIHVSGLTVVEDLEVRGNLKVRQDLQVLNQLIFEQGLQVFGETEFQNALKVSGLATFIGSANFQGNATFNNPAVFEKMVATSGIENKGDLIMFGNLLMQSGNTIDGVDVSDARATLIDHINDLDNPHGLTIEDLSGLPTTGGTLLGNLDLMSGVAIDDIDPTELKFLLDGSNADPVFDGPDLVKKGHTHDMSGITNNFLSFAPEYHGVIFSGIGRGIMSTLRDSSAKCNLYRWTGIADDVSSGDNLQPKALVQDIGVPGDFDKLSGLSIKLRTFNTSGSSFIQSIQVFDTDGTEVTLKDNENITSIGSLITHNIGIVSPNTPTWDKGEIFSVLYNLKATSGSPVDLGNSSLEYLTVFPQP